MQFQKLGLGEDDVIRPEGSLGSHIEYLKSLDDSDLIEIPSHPWSHGLRGKISNNARSKERELFREWVELNRSPTGRIQL